MTELGSSNVTQFTTMSHWLTGVSIAMLSLNVLAQAQPHTAPLLPQLATENQGTEAPANTTSALQTDSPNAVGNGTSNVSAKPPEVSQAWLSLNKRQKQALAPLSDKWDELTHQQKQKWLVLARSFYQLTDPEQIVLHGRMREWASLSPRQRALARFNFNSTMAMSIEDKRAQWEAYQQLSEEEKNKLTSGLKAPSKSAARSTTPPNKRLVKPPPVSSDTSKIFQTIAPRQPIHPKTLLPLPPR